MDRPSRERWLALMMTVRRQFAYCVMYGVGVMDGMLVSCEAVQRSVVFGPAKAPIADDEPALDPNWQALQALCERMGMGRLTELRFSGGRPVGARISEGGRKFR